jgi:hypothetical protein
MITLEMFPVEACLFTRTTQRKAAGLGNFRHFFRGMPFQKTEFARTFQKSGNIRPRIPRSKH